MKDMKLPGMPKSAEDEFKTQPAIGTTEQKSMMERLFGSVYSVLTDVAGAAKSVAGAIGSTVESVVNYADHGIYEDDTAMKSRKVAELDGKISDLMDGFSTDKRAVTEAKLAEAMAMADELGIDATGLGKEIAARRSALAASRIVTSDAGASGSSSTAPMSYTDALVASGGANGVDQMVTYGYESDGKVTTVYDMGDPLVDSYVDILQDHFHNTNKLYDSHNDYLAQQNTGFHEQSMRGYYDKADSHNREMIAAIDVKNFDHRGSEFDSALTSMVPGIGDVKDWAEVFTGQDVITGRELETWERGVTAGAGLLPIVGGTVVRRGVSEVGEQIAKRSDDVIDAGLQALKKGDAALDSLADAAKNGANGRIIPTHEELISLKIPGFQSHHILPQYLGKMLGYTESQMMKHPATLISQYLHTGKLNPDAFHKVVSRYLPPMKNGNKAFYNSGQIYNGLKNAYRDLNRSELFDVIKNYIE